MATLSSGSAVQDSSARGSTPAPAAMVAAAGADDAVHDFDFLHGTWRIHNWRLRQPLVSRGSTRWYDLKARSIERPVWKRLRHRLVSTSASAWYEFEAFSVERPLWEGEANLEEYDGTLPDGTRLRALALRLYDPDSRLWTIHWSNSTSGTLDPPMTGTFQNGLGEFYGHDDYLGRRIQVRFHWQSVGPNEARWEQAFSADGGKTWETNWIMEFTRMGSEPR